MYTAINTLSGHYASYGNKYPVPEKRKTRLAQQYKEIERALARGNCARALRIGLEATRLEARIGSCCDNAGAAVDFCCAGLRC
eukprot:scaffold14757_cov111-Isochrysis_galbana.AAC.2